MWLVRPKCRFWCQAISPYSESVQIRTTKGAFIRIAVSISCEFIMNPASPVTATTLRSG